MFAAPSPLKVAKASFVRARQPEIARDDRRSGWTSVLEAARWQRSHAEETIHAWVGEVRSLIDSSRDGRPNIVLLTGDFAHTEGGGSVDELLVRPATMIAELARELKVPVDRLDPGAISMGAALYASRRARQWATYLDELPPVEIVVQSSGGARWQHLLKEPHYDAGAPVEIKLDHFSLNAGERQILLPVYVHEFGDDTAHVLATEVKFTQATSARTAAEVVVEVEAATGLPVVRATVGGAVNETAEVDWANDRESARTDKTKTGYLNSLPRAFPPIEERVAGDWWMSGGKYKTVTLPAPDGREYTGEALGVRLVALFTGAEIRFAPALKGFLRLAVKREWDATKLRWVAPTDESGCNHESRSLEAAADVLYKAVFHDWSKPSLANTAGRALSALCWRGKEWIAHLMDSCADVEQMKELHYVIAGLGSCVHAEADMGRAVNALAMRLHDKVYVAQATRKQPVGIHTLKAMGNLFAHRPEALKCVRDEVATQLAEDITQFIELTLEHGKFMQKFQAALRALVYLTRRRAYQDGFLPVDSVAFRRAVSCCAKVYIAVRLAAEGVAWAAAQHKLVTGYKSDLKALYVPGRAARGSAHESTCRVIDEVDMSRVRMDGTKFPNNPDKLLTLLVQVVEYIEGRGTGILVIDDDENDESDGDGDGN
jgi:hypothetical protein